MKKDDLNSFLISYIIFVTIFYYHIQSMPIKTHFDEMLSWIAMIFMFFVGIIFILIINYKKEKKVVGNKCNKDDKRLHILSIRGNQI